MIKYSKRGKSRRITLADDLSIEQAVEMQTAFLKCLKADHVQVDCKDVTNLDLSIIQVLLAAKNSYKANKVGLEFEKTKNIQPFLQQTGINLIQ